MIKPEDEEMVKSILEGESSNELEEDDESGISRIEPMSDDEVVAYCKQEVSRGIGGEDNTDYNNVSLAYDYYFGRTPGLSKQEARDAHTSRFVSMDVMDTVEATVAEIMPTFITQQIAYYEPDDEMDVDAAREESELVNYIFFNQCDGYNILQQGLRDALLNRNCTAKVYWDEREEVTYETYVNVTMLALPGLMAPQQPGEVVEIVSQEEEMADGEMREETNHEANESGENDDEYTYAMEQEEGEEQEVEFLDPFATYKIQIKRSRIIEKPMIEGVAPEQTIVTAGHLKPTLYDVRFCAHEKIETQTSLLAQGFDEDMVAELPDYNSSTVVDAQSRSRLPEENDYYSSDEATRYIKVYECYCLLDVDGDGIAERRKIVYAEDTILSNDPWESVALIGGVATPVPHKYVGVSLFDRIKDIQDSKTPVLRSIINGTQLSSNPRIGVVKGQASIDDLLTSRTGGVVRAKTRDSVFEIPSAEVPQSSYSFVDLMDRLRKERGGSAVNTASTAMQIQGDTAHGVERAMSAMELSNALLARTFGESFIKGIFVEMHHIIRENFTGPMTAKSGSKWITSVPGDWKSRANVSISIGASNAERMRQTGVMEKLIQLQGMLAEKGSVMVDESKTYNAIMRSLTLGGIKNPEDYLTDPQSPEGMQKTEQKGQQNAEEQAKQDAMEQAMAKAQTDMAAAEIMKGQAALTSQQAKFTNDQLQNQIDGLQLQLDDKSQSEDTQFKYAKLRSDEALSLTEMEQESKKDLSAQQAENKNELEL